MKLALTTVVVTAALALYVPGCGEQAHTISDNERITTVSGIDAQDFDAAARALSQDMIISGFLDRAPRKPATLAISQFINNTPQQVDQDSLLKKIRIALLQSGKVQVTTVVGLGGMAEDPLARDQAAKNRLYNPGQAPMAGADADYSLTVKLIQTYARAGSLKQSNVSFQMSVTDVRSGTAVWEGEKEVTKRGSRAGVGL